MVHVELEEGACWQSSQVDVEQYTWRQNLLSVPNPLMKPPIQLPETYRILLVRLEASDHYMLVTELSKHPSMHSVVVVLPRAALWPPGLKPGGTSTRLPFQLQNPL